MTTPSFQPFLVSNGILTDPVALRVRMSADGYLFFRQLVAPDTVTQVRRDVLSLCRDAGWIKPGSDLMEGIVAEDRSPLREGMPDYMPVYKKILKLPSFYELPNDPALVRVAQDILGQPPLVHPRRIGRITFPGLPEATTPPHQDFHYIRGTANTYTAWMPLGDCPVNLGGLAVLRGSQRAGFVEHTVRTPGAVGGIGIDPDRDFGTISTDWRTGDFLAGDVLMFHAYTVHQAMPNLSPDRLRLSTDNRYQRNADPIHASSLGTHFDL
jgi:ectoine hydroxylase-related dioxygenase (phytanoyl-CoA dioxygenase family)